MVVVARKGEDTGISKHLLVIEAKSFSKDMVILTNQKQNFDSHFVVLVTM